VKTKPATAVAATASTTPASVPSTPPPKIRVNPTLAAGQAERRGDVPETEQQRARRCDAAKPQALFRAPCRTPRNANSSGITVCSGMMIMTRSRPRIRWRSCCS
jgi:hypothetical protein